jgi:hypothetical protein
MSEMGVARHQAEHVLAASKGNVVRALQRLVEQSIY